MNAELDQFDREDLEEMVKVQRESIGDLHDRVEALEARCEAQSRQLSVIKRTVAGSADEFAKLSDGEGYDVVGRIEQYEAALDGFAERLGDIQEAQE